MCTFSASRGLVIGIAWALLWCVPGRAQTQVPTTSRSVLEQPAFADRLFEQEEYELSILEYRRFLFTHPADSSADQVRYKLGLCYMALDQWNKAEPILGHLAEESTERELMGAVLFSRGMCCDRQREVDAARYQYRSVVTEFRDSDLADDAQLMLALTYVENQRWLDASTEFLLLAREFQQSPLAPVAHRLAAESAAGIHLPHRSVTASGVFSAFLPGAGQMWCGLPADGFFSFLFTSAFSALALTSHRNGNESSAFLLGAVGLSFYMGNIYGAVNAAESFNARHADELRTRLRDEAIAALR